MGSEKWHEWHENLQLFENKNSYPPKVGENPAPYVVFVFTKRVPLYTVEEEGYPKKDALLENVTLGAYLL
jgi:hypothetical protein